MAETSRVDYSGTISTVYNQARSLTSETLCRWANAAADHVVVSGVVCDLGAGTGRFSAPLARRLGRPVAAVEPAAGMRAQIPAHADVFAVAGRGESVPLRTGSCALVWMSQMLHHVDDLAACAREVRRIAAPGARVLLRGLLEVRDGWVLAPYFPGAATLVEDTFPTLERILDAFAQTGLGLHLHDRIDQAVAADGSDLVARTRLRADSTLARIPDDQFWAGVALLEADAEAGLFSAPIVETIDLISLA